MNEFYIIYLPPIGAAKLQATPTAQAAANISLARDSFCNQKYASDLS